MPLGGEQRFMKTLQFVGLPNPDATQCCCGTGTLFIQEPAGNLEKISGSQEKKELKLGLKLRGPKINNFVIGPLFNGGLKYDTSVGNVDTVLHKKPWHFGRMPMHACTCPGGPLYTHELEVCNTNYQSEGVY